MTSLPFVTVEEMFRICNNHTNSREASFSWCTSADQRTY